MADLPRMPDTREVGEWLYETARRHHIRIVQIRCHDRAHARIWRAVLKETRVPAPFPITVRLWAPRHERVDSFADFMTLRPDDMDYEAITVEVPNG